MAGPLNVATLHRLAGLARCVEGGKPITRVVGEHTVYGIARAFTHEGGGFLGADDDVREAYVWMSGGSLFSEQWWPVYKLLAGLEDGTVALNYAS